MLVRSFVGLYRLRIRRSRCGDGWLRLRFWRRRGRRRCFYGYELVRFLGFVSFCISLGFVALVLSGLSLFVFLGLLSNHPSSSEYHVHMYDHNKTEPSLCNESHWPRHGPLLRELCGVDQLVSYGRLSRFTSNHYHQHSAISILVCIDSYHVLERKSWLVLLQLTCEVFCLFQIHLHQDLPSPVRPQALPNEHANQKEFLVNYILLSDLQLQPLLRHNLRNHVLSRSRILGVGEELNGDLTRACEGERPDHIIFSGNGDHSKMMHVATRCDFHIG